MSAYSDVDEPSGSDAADDLIEEDDDDVIDLDDEPVTTGQFQYIDLQDAQKFAFDNILLQHILTAICCYHVQAPCPPAKFNALDRACTVTSLSTCFGILQQLCYRVHG